MFAWHAQRPGYGPGIIKLGMARAGKMAMLSLHAALVEDASAVLIPMSDGS